MEGEGFRDYFRLPKVKNPIRRVRDNIQLVQTLIHGREGYSPNARSVLEKYGNDTIVSGYLVRNPLQSALVGALDTVSFGQFSAHNGYDKLFHLALVVRLSSGQEISLEKEEVIKLHLSNNLQNKQGYETRNVNITQPLTLNQLLDNTEKRMGKQLYFSYNASSNNCQKFIYSILQANGIGTPQDYEFVKQDTESIFRNLPSLRQQANSVVHLGQVGNILTEGVGLKRHVKRYNVVKRRIIQ